MSYLADAIKVALEKEEREKQEKKAKICDYYCKFPEEYLAFYKDPDVAWDNLSREKCEMCPLNK